MRCNLIACGPTGSLWDGSGHSIGVNDCWKFGRPTEALLIVDGFQGVADRERAIIIRNSRPKYFFSQRTDWGQQPGYKRIEITRWRGEIRSGEIYHNNGSSPFIALSLCHVAGFKEVVMYGVDLVGHPVLKGELLEKQVRDFKEFGEQLEMRGTKVYLASAFGALKDIFPAK